MRASKTEGADGKILRNPLRRLDQLFGIGDPAIGLPVGQQEQTANGRLLVAPDFLLEIKLLHGSEQSAGEVRSAAVVDRPNLIVEEFALRGVAHGLQRKDSIHTGVEGHETQLWEFIAELFHRNEDHQIMPHRITG